MINDAARKSKLKFSNMQRSNSALSISQDNFKNLAVKKRLEEELNEKPDNERYDSVE